MFSFFRRDLDTLKTVGRNGTIMFAVKISAQFSTSIILETWL